MEIPRVFKKRRCKRETKIKREQCEIESNQIYRTGFKNIYNTGDRGREVFNPHFKKKTFGSVNPFGLFGPFWLVDPFGPFLLMGLDWLDQLV